MNPTEEFRLLMNSGRSDTHTACRLFDRLGIVELETLIGTWRGREFYTGHPLDGVLKKLNWYGKAFHDAENVDPLLFRGPDGKVFAVDPVPVLDMRKLVKATGGKARMRMVKYRGKVSAAMIYDNLPIQDHFRKVDEDRLLGMMDWKGSKEPYFFVLERSE